METDDEPVSDAEARKDVRAVLKKNGIVVSKSVVSEYCPNTGRKQKRRRAAIDTVPA